MSSSDEAYAAFLDRANQAPHPHPHPHPDPHRPVSAGFRSTKAIDPAAGRDDVPPALQNVHQHTYTSETDAPFEPVRLTWRGAALPTEREFQALVDADADAALDTDADDDDNDNVSRVSLAAFDPRNQYTDVIEMVRAAAAGATAVTGVTGSGHGLGLGGQREQLAPVAVYRVPHGPTRAEYFVVGMDAGRARLVGVRVRAVES
ncbi:MAG: hypothetical protein M1826_007534 [Phylliscum demangeonii]|nr:MAG: hypothetical protein M1826_007534 [Phylliscum demangeonii]